MRVVGRPAGPVRPPLTDLNEAETAELAALVDAVTIDDPSSRIMLTA